MRKLSLATIIIFFGLSLTFGQSGRVQTYSESLAPEEKNPSKSKAQLAGERETTETKVADDVIRVDTDLVVIPVQINDRGGKPVSDVRRGEFKIFENGVEQEIAYFSDGEQPFTVALVLDMSYSSVFKLQEIQKAAMTFVNQLRSDDKVMIVSFDEKARVLCEPTNNRKVLRLAIEATKIASGTSLYTALDLVLNEKMSRVSGRKAVVLLSDGVDTSSPKLKAEDILQMLGSTDVLIYPIQYDTYDDVQKSRKNDAQVFYDEDDRPYVVEAPRKKGEREEDYREADYFLKETASQTGGKIFRVSSTTNLNSAFAKIAEELRKVYSLGYYPSSERKFGVTYTIKVRVYRPNLTIKARTNYLLNRNKNAGN